MTPPGRGVLEEHDTYARVVSEPQGQPEAIVRPGAGREAFEITRIAPSAALAPFVDYHWLLRWSVPAPHVQRVVPLPRVNVTAEDGRLLVTGVTRRPFERTLVGSGTVLGAAFLPAGFRPLLGRRVDALSETVQPAAEVLGIDDAPTAERIGADGDPDELVEALERYLLRCEPVDDPTARDVTALVRYAEATTTLTRAAALAEHAGTSLRTLQRLFAEHVGVGPKWVIQRFRLLEAATAAHRPEPTDWAALAVELGFSDQAHLTRIFTDVVGVPPATYARDPRTTGSGRGTEGDRP